jgi:hypothetical protein
MERITVCEGQPLVTDLETADAVRTRLLALQSGLRPRIGFLAGTDAAPVVQNLVGSVQVTPGVVLDVVPKTQPGQNWAASIVDLLADDRAAFGGATQNAEQMPRLILADALALLYADQLDRAVRREGPLAVLIQQDTSRPRLAGRLDVSSWVRTSLAKPTHFPQRETVLTIDNPFTRALAWVAEALAVRCADATLAVRLRQISARMRPGLPQHAYVDPNVSVREVPPQWRAYEPAWATACAVLRRVSPLHRSGVLDGFGLAIEPWPLLERLLVRVLHAAARQAALVGIPLRAEGHGTYPLLRPDAVADPPPPLARLSRVRSVEPDGSLWFGSEIVANFEAKYSRADSDATFRSHVFQAMTTAAALDSPLAVLVYPEASAPVTWTVHGFNDRPLQLVALGLDMYSYRRGAGDESRAALLLDTLRANLPSFEQAAG